VDHFRCHHRSKIWLRGGIKRVLLGERRQGVDQSMFKGISLSQSCETTAWDGVLATTPVITYLWILSDGIDTRPSVNLLMLSLLARLVCIRVCVYQMSAPNLASPLFGAVKDYFFGTDAVPSAAWNRIQARRACMANVVAYEFVPELFLSGG
jgi:hypothetical protein